MRLFDRLFSRYGSKPILTDEERREALRNRVLDRIEEINSPPSEHYSRFGRMESSLRNSNFYP